MSSPGTINYFPPGLLAAQSTGGGLTTTYSNTSTASTLVSTASSHLKIFEFDDFEEKMNSFFSGIPIVGQFMTPREKRVDLRLLDSHSRILDGYINLDSNAATSPAGRFAQRMIQSPLSAFKTLWNNTLKAGIPFLSGSSNNPQTLAKLRKQKYSKLCQMPAEVIMEILDQADLSDSDRWTFGVTCSNMMTIALPSLYRYALLRYPIKNEEKYRNYKVVGSCVRNLILFLPADAEHIINEAHYIPLFDILDQMYALQSVTMYFEATTSIVELDRICQYLFETKPRLQKLTIDIRTLDSRSPTFDPTVVYAYRRSNYSDILRARPPGGYSLESGAELRHLSLVMTNVDSMNTATTLVNRISPFARKVNYLRYVPQLNQGGPISPDLLPFSGRRIESLTYPVRGPGTMEEFQKGLNSACGMNPASLRHLTVYGFFNVGFLPTFLGAPSTFPCKGIVTLNIIVWGNFGGTVYLHNNNDVRTALQGSVNSLFMHHTNFKFFMITEVFPSGGSYRLIATRSNSGAPAWRAIDVRNDG